jgi:putative two-component system response regulator
MAAAKRILLVDDQETMLDLLEVVLKAWGYETERAKDGFEAMAKVELDIDLIILDLEMPGMDGFEVTKQVRASERFRDIPIIISTALTNRETRLRAVEYGANDYITKPIDRTELQVRAASLLKLKESQDAIKRHQVQLEEKVAQRTNSLRRALEEMVEAKRKAYEANLETIFRLAVAAEHKDKDTAAHIRRMSRFCAILARRCGLLPNEVEVILYASPLHDVGKLGIPDAILCKPGKLTDEEWVVMRQHSVLGGRILMNSSSELLRAGHIIALNHHEKWDGSGYPKGLKGEDIPLQGRICAVADVFDALTSERPYKKAFPNEKAMEILEEGKDKHFDAELVDKFVASRDEVIAVQQEITERSGQVAEQPD